MTARKAAAVVAALLTTLAFTPARASAWGKEGHVIVARIAELNLSPKARDAVSGLLPDTGYSNSKALADSTLANYADVVKHNSHFPQYDKSGPWHFVDIPVEPKTEFNADQHCKNGACVLGKIEEFKLILADKNMPKERRQEALVFLVHLVGDLHQPLHCATRGDTGGNDLRVKYLGKFGHHLNLHSVWDDNLVQEVLVGTDPLQTADKLNDAITNARAVRRRVAHALNEPEA